MRMNFGVMASRVCSSFDIPSMSYLSVTPPMSAPQLYAEEKTMAAGSSDFASAVAHLNQAAQAPARSTPTTSVGPRVLGSGDHSVATQPCFTSGTTFQP